MNGFSIRFPQDETGKQRKLSRPWHGPYRVTALTQTDVTAVKVYYPNEGTIQVHMNRVVKCPSGFPPGCFWYGNKRRGPGRPPKWIDKLVKKSTTPEEVSDDSEDEQLSDGDGENSDVESKPESESENESNELESSPTPQTSHLTRTRTRTVKPPNRLMQVRSGSS